MNDLFYTQNSLQLTVRENGLEQILSEQITLIIYHMVPFIDMTRVHAHSNASV